MLSAAHRRVVKRSMVIGAILALPVTGYAQEAVVIGTVTDSTGLALYFSRATIPFDRDGAGPRYYKHLGFYAYRKDPLDRFVRWPESSLERSERLEQLRFLENGVPIYAAETPFDTVGVDTEEDVRRVEEILRGSQKSEVRVRK